MRSQDLNTIVVSVISGDANVVFAGPATTRRVRCARATRRPWAVTPGGDLRAAGPNDGTLRRPPEKAGIDKGVNHEPAVIRSHVPESSRLGQRQLQARHLHELVAHAIDKGCKAHGTQRSNRRASFPSIPILQNSEDSRAQQRGRRVCWLHFSSIWRLRRPECRDSRQRPRVSRTNRAACRAGVLLDSSRYAEPTRRLPSERRRGSRPGSHLAALDARRDQPSCLARAAIPRRR